MRKGQNRWLEVTHPVASRHRRQIVGARSYRRVPNCVSTGPLGNKLIKVGCTFAANRPLILRKNCVEYLISRLDIKVGETREVLAGQRAA
jgi:hypothetical protein